MEKASREMLTSKRRPSLAAAFVLATWFGCADSPPGEDAEVDADTDTTQDAAADSVDSAIPDASDEPDVPGEPDSADDRVVQAFLHTDICSNSLLTTGQQFELQVRLDL